MIPVTVVFVTWNRREELFRTVEAFLKNVFYDHNLLTLHIADDNSPEPYIYDIIKNWPEYNWTYSITNRKGWGANVNAAFKVVGTDYIFLNEDDYVAQAPFNLQDGIRVLEEVPDIGCIRYNHLKGHLGMRLDVGQTPSQVHYLRIIKAESKFLYVYSNRPHLQHRRFWEAYGAYPEGMKLGETEETYAKWVFHKPGPDVAILYNGTIDYNHIGHSFQLSKDDFGV
jgi:hypothetical protein